MMVGGSSSVVAMACRCSSVSSIMAASVPPFYRRLHSLDNPRVHADEVTPIALPVYFHHEQDRPWLSAGTTSGTRKARRATRRRRVLFGLKADRKAQARVAQLARKCNEGELTLEEHHEYEFYVMAGEFIAIL